MLGLPLSTAVLHGLSSRIAAWTRWQHLVGLCSLRVQCQLLSQWLSTSAKDSGELWPDYFASTAHPAAFWPGFWWSDTPAWSVYVFCNCGSVKKKPFFPESVSNFQVSFCCFFFFFLQHCCSVAKSLPLEIAGQFQVWFMQLFCF